MLHILGAGSLGLLWAARLTRAGLPCRLLLRDARRQTEWQSRNNLLIFEQASQRELLTIETLPISDCHESIERLIVATKAHEVHSALSSLPAALLDQSDCLLLQNGLGSQQQAQALLPNARVLFASVTDGAWCPAPGHVCWAGIGETRIGDPQGGTTPAWLNLLDQAGIVWHWDNQILEVLWLKLAVNCAINPFTALFDCRNGDVPARAGVRLEQVIDELHSLLSIAARSPGRQALGERIHSVIQATAGNSSSMRQDIHARRRTEIDYILGYACREARQRGLQAPALTSLHEELKALLDTLGLPRD